MPNSSSPEVNYALLDDFSIFKASGADALELGIVPMHETVNPFPSLIQRGKS